MEKNRLTRFAAAAACAMAIVLCLPAGAMYFGGRETALADGEAETYASYVADGGMCFSLNADGAGYTVTGYEEGITQADIPDEFSGLPVTGVDDYAFMGAEALEYLYIPKGMTYIGEGAFSGCTALKYIYFGAENLDDMECDNSVFLNAGSASGGIELVIGKDVKRVPACLMYSSRYLSDAPYLSALTFEEGCGAESVGEYAFYDMNKLTSIVLPETVKEIGGMAFFYCTKWKGEVYLPSIETICSGAFTDCQKLEGVHLGKNLTEIGARAFKSCIALKSVIFENPYGWSVTDESGGEETELDAEDVADSDTVITFLTYNTLYVEYIWHREADTEAPVIYGAGEESGTYFVNSSFTVAAEDTGSGVKCIYVLLPGESEYMCVEGDSVSIVPAADGEYVFFAEDNEGNISPNYFVFFDVTPPVLSVTGAVFGGITSSPFTVAATDGSGAEPVLYMQAPGEAYVSCGGSETYVDMSYPSGVYSFFAIDLAGNMSETYTVTLDSDILCGYFVEDTGSASLYFWWDSDAWTASLDGDPYERGTWITGEGTHTVILYSPYGSSVTYTAEIGHFLVLYEIFASTCTEEGYTRYICLQCDEFFDDDFTEKTGHTYAASHEDGTCVTPGTVTYTCTVCGYSFAVQGVTGEHDYVSDVVPPTCTDAGYTYVSCSVCGDGYITDVVEALGHDYAEEVILPTCTEEGKTVYTCKRCDYAFEDITAPAAGHTYDTGRYVAANCTRAGGYIYTCEVCGYTYTEESGLPTDHSYTVTVTKSATCTEDGIRHYECDTCGYSYDTVIEASGHSYRIVSIEYTDGGSVRRMVCDICGDEITEEIEDGGEYVASYIEYIFEIYSRYVWWILLIVAGIWSIVMGVRYAMARRAEDKEKAKRMVSNYLIGLAVIAVVIVAAPYLVYGIASLFT